MRPISSVVNLHPASHAANSLSMFIDNRALANIISAPCLFSHFGRIGAHREAGHGR